jgi:L-malate glycosyltransferase
MKSRVLHIIDLLSIGGAQKLLITFSIEAEKYPLDVEIISLHTAIHQSVVSDLEARGVKISYFPARKLLDPVRFIKILKYIKTTQPDIIQTHLTYSNILGGLAGLFAGVPVIGTLHSSGKDRRYSKTRETLETWVLRLFTYSVVAVGNKTAAAHFPRLGKNKIRVIENGISDFLQLSEEERQTIRHELVGNKNVSIIVTVGRLSPVKGYEYLISGFKIIHTQFPNTKLVFVGDGQLMRDLKTQASSLQLEDSIHFLGDRSDVPSILAASDIYINSSVIEGMPLAVMEAMAVGLPIIATDVGDMPEMVTDDCGIIIPAKNPERVASAAIELLTHPEKLEVMGRHARELAERNFSGSAWLDKLLSLYDEAIQKKG